MRIKKINIMKFLIYPHALNPFYYVALSIYTLYILFCSWIIRVDAGSSWEFRISLKDFKSHCKDLFLAVVGMFINTMWFHVDLTSSYMRFLEKYWFPNYPVDDWRREHELKECLERFKKLNIKVNGED